MYKLARLRLRFIRNQRKRSMQDLVRESQRRITERDMAIALAISRMITLYRTKLAYGDLFESMYNAAKASLKNLSRDESDFCIARFKAEVSFNAND